MGVGGVLCKAGLGTLGKILISGGGVFCAKSQNRGVLGKFGQIFWKPSWLVHHR